MLTHKIFFALSSAMLAAIMLSACGDNAVTSIKGEMTADDIAALAEKYPELETLDLRGSRSYEEILAYIAANPDIDVLYDVNVDNVLIDSTMTTLDWSGHSCTALASMSDALQQLEIIDLGSAPQNPEDIALLRESFPNASLRYTLRICEKDYSNTCKAIDLRNIRSEEIDSTVSAISQLPELKSIKLAGVDSENSMAFETYTEFFNARPDVSYDYSFELFGQTINTMDSSLSYKKVSIGNEGADQISNVLNYLPRLSELRIDRCDIDDERMAQLRAAFPDKSIQWRIFFSMYSCMTDVEKIWANFGLYDNNIGVLQYCTNVKYLDIGHGSITDISFVNNMPDLEVAIFSMNQISDITPLAGCPKLEYLELTLTLVSDLTPLSGLTELRHLELSQMSRLTDISPVYELDLDRLQVMYSHGLIPLEQFEIFTELHPECYTNFRNSWEEDPYNASNWRYSSQGGYAERYQLLREQIGYDDPYGMTKLYPWED